MTPRHQKKQARVFAIFIACMVLWGRPEALSADVVYDCGAKGNRDKSTTIEMVLSKKWKGQVEEVKRALVSDAERVKVRLRFYPALDPPTNIGIGKCVPTDVARRAIQEAIKYSGKIDRLIRQDILPHHWIKIGSTGRDFAPSSPSVVSACSICRSTSSPAIKRPKEAYWPLSLANLPRQMKNWQLAESGSSLRHIERTPRSCRIGPNSPLIGALLTCSS